MSFELAFWYEQPPPSADTALESYLKLAEGDSEVAAPHAAVGQFFDEVVEAYGDLKGEDAERAPWVSPIYATDECVILSLVGSRAPELVPRLLETAARNHLVAYAPQNRAVYSPSVGRLDP